LIAASLACCLLMRSVLIGAFRVTITELLLGSGVGDPISFSLFLNALSLALSSLCFSCMATSTMTDVLLAEDS